MEKTVKWALVNAIVTAAYVALVASFMYFEVDGKIETVNTIFIPIAMLMLFVFSAALCGTLVFGRPLMWYLDGKKKEALSLLFYTLGVFLILILFVFLIVYLVFI